MIYLKEMIKIAEELEFKKNLYLECEFLVKINNKNTKKRLLRRFLPLLQFRYKYKKSLT